MSASQRRDGSPRIILPGLAFIIAVSIPQVVIRDDVRGFPPGPRSLDAATQVVESVYIGIVVGTLKVFSDLRPGMGC